MKKVLIFTRLNNNQAIRYIISGICSFLTENCTFLLFYYLLELSPMIANISSICIALSVNFFLSKYYVFSNPKNTSRITKQLPSYLLLVACNAAISTYSITILIAHSVPAYLAKLLITTLIICWTYFIYKRYIFKK